MVTDERMQAKSAIAHSSLFLEKIPKKFHYFPSPRVSGASFKTCIPLAKSSTYS
jgi:hypothetical protein